MSRPLILALPSKGRLKAQVEDWLDACGLKLISEGARAYAARLEGFGEIEVRLASAADIVGALAEGEAHLGVTGEDLLEEARLDQPFGLALARLAFGRADLVVAVPASWLDVETMADLDAVAHQHHLRTGKRLRIATKYPRLTRAFFAGHGLADYRIVESGGATEGAPAAGLADAITDITTTGATLAANGLKPIDDGLILASQARFAASLGAQWSAADLDVARRLTLIIEAARRARDATSLIWPAAQDRAARRALEPIAGIGEERTNGMLVTGDQVFAAAAALARAGVGPVSVTQPRYLFQPTSAAFEAFAAALEARPGGQAAPAERDAD